MKDVADCKSLLTFPQGPISLPFNTFVEPIHVELTNEGGDIGMFEVLPARISLLSILVYQYLRQNFREIGGGGHDETLIVARPGDQVLYRRVLQHARTG
jgi:hypothetical protein